MNKDLIIHKLTDENSALAEALGQSTAARGKQADTIARLERENADLRREVAALATELAGTVTALTKVNHTADELRHQLRLAAQQPGRKPLVTLTDRGNGDGYALPVDVRLYNTGDEY